MCARLRLFFCIVQRCELVLAALRKLLGYCVCRVPGRNSYFHFYVVLVNVWTHPTCSWSALALVCLPGPRSNGCGRATWTDAKGVMRTPRSKFI